VTACSMDGIGGSGFETGPILGLGRDEIDSLGETVDAVSSALLSIPR